MSEISIRSIATVHSDFPSKFGIPRQAGIVEELESSIVFEPEFRNPEALRGLEQFSHIWVIWQFSEAVRDTWSPTVRPPRLGGNVRVGVFATRSPFRPNHMGLSCVRLLGIEDTEHDGKILRIAGADMMDGTPVFDIKPYIAYSDAKPDAVSGFAPDSGKKLKVTIPGTEEAKLPEEKRKALRGILANDPRPRYQKDPERIYAMEFAEVTVRFRVEEDELSVVKIEKE